MSAPVRLRWCAAAVLGASLSAQIPADLVERRRAEFHTQATDADMKREGGTPLYGKMFFPRGFRSRGRWPAVVVGHGINALSIGIEKYGARFADRGLVAMAIDYQSNGFSGSGTDMAGGHALIAAATDARVKAAVGQVPIIDEHDVPRKAFAPSPETQAELVRLARTGDAPGNSVSAETMNVAEAKIALAEDHPFWYADAVPQATAMLFVVAEKDLKVNNATNAVTASKLIKGPNGVTAITGAGHALATPGAFEAAVEAAAWFKYL